MTAPPPDDPAGPEPPSRPGTSTFTIEGRSAPGLFVLGWLATLIGLGAVFVAFMGGGRAGLPWVLVAGLIVLSIGLISGAGAQAIERKARGGRGYVGPSPFLVFAAAIPVSGILAIGAGAVLSWFGIAVDGPLGALASVTLQTVVYIGLVRLLVIDTGALSWADMLITRPSGAAAMELVLGAGWAFPVIVATLPVAFIISRFIPTPPPSVLPPTGDVAGLVLHLITGAVLAPIGEELLFRGFATTAWIRDMGIPRGLIRGALFFAVVHVLTISGDTAGNAMATAVAAFLGRVPIALALGYLFVRRGTIWAPLGLHATFNAILLILQEMAFRNGVPPA